MVQEEKNVGVDSIGSLKLADGNAAFPHPANSAPAGMCGLLQSVGVELAATNIESAGALMATQ